jgi:hypothetical protein
MRHNVRGQAERVADLMLLDASNRGVAGQGLLSFAAGPGAIHQEAAAPGNERIVSAGRFHEQRNRRGPYVLFSVCRAAHESPIDPGLWSGGNRRTSRRIRRCACRSGESAEMRSHPDRFGGGTPAVGVDPARR